MNSLAELGGRYGLATLYGDGGQGGAVVLQPIAYNFNLATFA